MKACPLSVGRTGIRFVVRENKWEGNFPPIELPEAVLMGLHQASCGDLDRSSPVFLFDQERVGEGRGVVVTFRTGIHHS